MAALIQTIAVVDKSGKAVSTSKHLVNVFKEARAAYRERKAEVVAGRHHELEEKTARKSLKAATLNDNSTTSSQKHSRSHHGGSRPSTDCRHTSGSYVGDSSTIRPSSHRHHLKEPESPRSPRSSTSKSDALKRRYSDDFETPRPLSLQKRSMTAPPTEHFDMDLAYGPIPPPLPVARQGDEAEFKSLVQKVKRILEEADCLQYTATAIIASLQKNPDAMAAVALTLAEISNIASKLAPGVLAAMKGSAPAVFALLASPQFLIAGGVAVGVTIVALGGYKIIKKTRAKKALEEPVMDEMLEIGGAVSRIDTWRRGIAEVEDHSVGTSVEGEFITPQAAALSRLNLNECRSSEIRREEVGIGSKKTSSQASSRKEVSESASKAGSKTSPRGTSKTSSTKPKKEKKEKEKNVKKPSPLRLMLR